MKSHAANHTVPIKVCCSILIFSIAPLYHHTPSRSNPSLRETDQKGSLSKTDNSSRAVLKLLTNLTALLQSGVMPNFRRFLPPLPSMERHDPWTTRSMLRPTGTGRSAFLGGIYGRSFHLRSGYVRRPSCRLLLKPRFKVNILGSVCEIFK